MKMIERIYASLPENDVLEHKAMLKLYPLALRKMVENVETLEEFMTISHFLYTYNHGKIRKETEDELVKWLEIENKKPWWKKFLNKLYGRLWRSVYEKR